MPCWEVNTVSVEFHAKNAGIMMEVFAEMGITADLSKDGRRIETSIGTFDLRSGRAEVENRDVKKVNAFRVNYSKKVVETVAKKKKWILKQRSQQVFVAKKW